MSQIDLRSAALALLRYDPETGSLVWTHSKQSRFIGREAGSINHHGYRRVHVFNTRIDAHRLIWLMVHGVLPDCEIDHINGIKTDNRIENLRLATQQSNQQNTGVRKDNRIGVKGVRLRPSGRYQARVKMTDGSSLVKTFDTSEEAVFWLSCNRTDSHGEFANTPEQIAADEREAAIDGMVSVWRRTMGRFAIEEKGLAEMLYDDGYRKP